MEELCQDGGGSQAQTRSQTATLLLRHLPLPLLNPTSRVSLRIRAEHLTRVPTLLAQYLPLLEFRSRPLLPEYRMPRHWSMALHEMTA